MGYNTWLNMQQKMKRKKKGKNTAIKIINNLKPLSYYLTQCTGCKKSRPKTSQTCHLSQPDPELQLNNFE